MAIGFSSDSSNGSNGGHDDGSLTVAQIRAPSTPFDSDTDPFSDFHFSGREEVVTVKDVEEIVEAVKSSFAKFIEVQRSYIDQQSTTESTESKNAEAAESNASSSQSSTAVKNVDESNDSSNGLTEAAVSDIIEAISDKNESLNSEIQDSISELKNGISSKIDTINNEISEKLIESSTKENEDQKKSQNPTAENLSTGISANDMFMSFVEFMTNSANNTESRIDGLQESVDSISENRKDVEASNVLKREENLSNSSQTPISTNIEQIDISGLENKGIIGRDDSEQSIIAQENSNENLVNRIGDYFEKLFDDVGKMFSTDDSSNENTDNAQSSELSHSLSDVVNENNRLTKLIRTDVDGISKTIGGITNDGIAKSMVEMMVQNSMLQMISSNTVEGMSTMMTNMVDEKFGETIRALNKDNTTSSAPKDSKIETSSSSDNIVSDNGKNTENGKIETSVSTAKTVNPTVVDISKIDSSSNKDGKTNNNSATDVAPSNGKNEDEKAKQHTDSSDSSKKEGGLLSFIGDMFNSFVSLFGSDTSNESEENKSANNTVSSSENEVEAKELVSHPTTIAPTLDDKDKNELTVETEVVEETKTNISDNGKTNSDLDSLKLAIQRAGLNNENVLHILDSSYSDNEALLANFQELIDGFKNNDEGVEGAVQLGNVNADDLLSYYLSGKDARIEEMRRMNESIAAASASSSENDVNNTEKTDSEKEQNNKKNDENTSEDVVVEVLENRKLMMERFDRLETSLQSSSSSMPSTQTIYMPIPDTKFEVNRIG